MSPIHSVTIPLLYFHIYISPISPSLLPASRLPNLLRRLHTLRIIKQLRRIILLLDLPQPIQTSTIIIAHRLRPVHRRVRIVDIHAPLVLLHVIREALDPSIQEAESVAGIAARHDAVVELVQKQILGRAVGVRARVVGCVGGGGRDGRLGAAVHVDDDEPAAVDALGCVNPVVGDGLESGLREGGGDEGFGVEGFDLAYVLAILFENGKEEGIKGGMNCLPGCKDE